MNNKLTPTQTRIMKLLSDGMPHKKKELMDCIEDELSSAGNLRNHITKLRKKLPQDQLIILQAVNVNTFCYRLVRPLCSPYDGRN